jgi:hypothetical protein
VCKKPTWAGCGAHVDAVLGDVPPAERCQGHRREERTPATVGADGGSMAKLRGWLRR